MSKKNILVVIGYLLACGLLIYGLSLWLGPEEPTPNPVTMTENGNEEFIAPLKYENLNAYNKSMTNEQNPVAEFDTNNGKFQLELFEDTMPITAGNFIELAESGFYDQTKFHRIIPNFMIQGGDPLSKEADTSRYGTGGPGYTIPDEHVAGEYLTNIRGTVSMANSGPNSGGSQFFVNIADNTNLDFNKQPLSSKHPVFGKVISGMDVIDSIALVERNQRDLPLDHVIINSVKILR